MNPTAGVPAASATTVTATPPTYGYEQCSELGNRIADLKSTALHEYAMSAYTANDVYNARVDAVNRLVDLFNRECAGKPSLWGN